ncbi:MAG: hypothetical protein KGJ41_12295 [Rhodospirillales bacterium]|nr:hypothetical protein [Rhodospirillales bacterium]MDE2574158.1 hypothetical protein [Rhodospirillales bacterium]
MRWRLGHLGQWLWGEFRPSISPQTLNQKARAMGCRDLSARPRHHARAIGAIEASTKQSPARWRASPAIMASAEVH